MFQQEITTFAIVNIALMISPLFLTGRILSLLPKNLERKKKNALFLFTT